MLVAERRTAFSGPMLYLGFGWTPDYDWIHILHVLASASDGYQLYTVLGLTIVTFRRRQQSGPYTRDPESYIPGAHVNSRGTLV